MGTLLGYNDICEVVRPGGLITFTEYKLDRHQRRKPTVQVIDAPVETVIPPREAISRDQIAAFYGEVSDQDACVLASVPYIRLVIQVQDERNQPVFKVIGISSVFMGQGLQILEFTPATMPSVFSPAPANLLAEPSVKGFSDYQVGAGLYRNLPK